MGHFQGNWQRLVSTLSCCRDWSVVTHWGHWWLTSPWLITREGLVTDRPLCPCWLCCDYHDLPPSSTVWCSPLSVQPLINTLAGCIPPSRPDPAPSCQYHNIQYSKQDLSPDTSQVYTGDNTPSPPDISRARDNGWVIVGSNQDNIAPVQSAAAPDINYKHMKLSAPVEDTPDPTLLHIWLQKMDQIRC